MTRAEVSRLLGRKTVMAVPDTNEVFLGEITGYNLDHDPQYVVVTWSDGLEVNYPISWITSTEGPEVKIR